MESWGDLLKDNPGPGNPAQLLSKLYSTNSEPPEIANRWKKRHHPRIQSASIVASVKRPRSNHPRHRLILGMEVPPVGAFFHPEMPPKENTCAQKEASFGVGPARLQWLTDFAGKPTLAYLICLKSHIFLATSCNYDDRDFFCQASKTALSKS